MSHMKSEIFFPEEKMLHEDVAWEYLSDNVWHRGRIAYYLLVTSPIIYRTSLYLITPWSGNA